ncbi:NUC173 domain protein [Teladorsagia circumcincta]|uniref:NUC173 domain protein n=1 Tax=Teladorsagia circumcincta TaxID=45464 RepID=A0A2G9UVR4_TELCI|nr:NUC173 domain protein [Teladorsagia circumcincta]
MVVSVAALSAHEKPWVRTMARRVVRAVLTDPITAMENGLHAASSSVGMFIQQQLQSALASKNGEMTAMRYLCLLEGVMHKMPSSLFKQLAENILSSFAIADPMVKCSALQCLHRCLQRQPCDAALPVETNVLLVKALKQLSPPCEDITVCAYWMQALAEAHVCLTAKDPYRCYSLLPATLEIMVKFFDKGDEQLAQLTYQILARLIERSVQDNEECAKSLLSLLDRALNVHSTTTVGCAVRHVGAPAVLSVIPLGIDADAAILNTEFTRRLGSLDPVPQRLYMTLQIQLWELLPSFCDSPSDLEKSFPQLAPVLGAAMNERSDLRPQILSALRRVLRFALMPDAPPERVDVVSRYAKNFMPLLFNLYTANADDQDDKGVRMSVLETIRTYAEVTPKELVANFVDAAITKANGAFEDSPKQARILDILCAISRSADCVTLEKVMDTIIPWFDMNEMQKKAYRILEEVLAKRASPDLEPFFSSRCSDFENALLRPIATVAPPARAAFANNTHTRSNASKCLQYMFKKLIEMGAENEQQISSVLGGILARIYELATPCAGSDNGAVEMDIARSTLVALNIIAQKLLRVLNGGHVSRLVAHGCAWIGDGRPPVRILVIRLLRVLVQKLPEYALQQYRDLLINAVFEGQLTCDLTSKVRKANRLLLEVLVSKFGVDVLLKYTNKPEWVKQLRNIEKINRRKERQVSGGGSAKDSDEESSEAGSRMTARTAGADTILKILEDSDASESDAEGELAEMKSRTGSVWLKDDTDMGELTDLLDRKSMILKVTTTDPAQLAKRKAKLMEKKKQESGFRISKDGKLVIVDSDDENEGKRKRRKRGGDLDDLDDDFPVENKKKRDDDDMETDSEDDNKNVKNVSAKHSTVSGASTWRPGGQGIHRDTSVKGVKKRPAKSSGDKKNQKLQPYAYVPLRQKGVKQDLVKVLKSQRKAGVSKKNKKH